MADRPGFQADASGGGGVPEHREQAGAVDGKAGGVGFTDDIEDFAVSGMAAHLADFCPQSADIYADGVQHRKAYGLRHEAGPKRALGGKTLNSVTRWPDCAQRAAAAKPPMPAPMLPMDSGGDCVLLRTFVRVIVAAARPYQVGYSPLCRAAG